MASKAFQVSSFRVSRRYAEGVKEMDFAISVKETGFCDSTAQDFKAVNTTRGEERNADHTSR